MATFFGTNGDDNLNGSESADSIFAKSGSDAVQAGGGDDVILVDGGIGSSTSANDQLDGGAGTDTVVLSGNLSEYLVSFNPAGHVVLTGKAGTENSGSTETLIDIESVVFDDQVMRIVDANGTAGAYTTIQSAVDDSDAGDTVVVLDGTYTENVSVSKAVNIVGEGDDKVTINGAGYGIQLTGDIDSGGSSTVTISGIEFDGNSVGIQVASSTMLSHLIVDQSEFNNNSVHGIGSGSGASGLGAVTVTNTDFTDNGTGGSNGTGSIVLFGYSGDATITNVSIVSTGNFGDPTSGLPDSGIQIAGFDPTTYDVTHPLGAVALSNVSITGAYHKPLLSIQGYTDLTQFSAAGVQLTGNSTWGNLVFVDPIASSGTAAPGTPGYPGAFVGTGGVSDLDMSGISVNNTGESATDVFMRGTDANDAITGTDGNDVLNALAEGDNDYGGDDTLDGAAGDDVLFGGTGADQIDGGTGRDKIYGGAGNDSLSGGGWKDYLHGGEGNDTLEGGSSDDKLRGKNGKDILNGGSGSDDLKGGGGKDVLIGENGNDTLDGEGHNDKLTGGDGNDVLTGGSGMDTFIFNSIDETDGLGDLITDFVHGDDKIKLNVIDAKTGNGNQAFEFIGESDFSNTKGELRYDFDELANQVEVSGDVDGDGDKDFTIRLDGITSLTVDDFIL